MQGKLCSSALYQGTWTVTTMKCSPSLGTTASSYIWTMPEGEAAGGCRGGGEGGGQALKLCTLCLSPPGLGGIPMTKPPSWPRSPSAACKCQLHLPSHNLPSSSPRPGSIQQCREDPLLIPAKGAWESQIVPKIRVKLLNQF